MCHKGKLSKKIESYGPIIHTHITFELLLFYLEKSDFTAFINKSNENILFY